MPLPNLDPTERARWVILLIVALLQYIVLGVGLFVYPQYCKADLHTSALSGRTWLNELLSGHPDRIYIALGMRHHIFLALVFQLRAMGHMEARNSYINLDESVAIFLYTCITGIAIDHATEHFQHSHTTILQHFRKMVDILSGPDFYLKYVRQMLHCHQPSGTTQSGGPISVRGAIDGTHISCSPSAADLHTACSRKGGVTQNCLAAVSFDMRFLFFTSGWDGCAADSAMYSSAGVKNFFIPEGKHYLADAGFGICEALLVPFRSTRYHLAEWARAHLRPANFKELYNLRNASARNVVECIFGVVKHQWSILTRPPHYDMKVQAKIPSALVALHNFILEHDEIDLDCWIIDEQAQDDTPGFRRDQEINFGCLASSTCVSPAQKRWAENIGDEMAHSMWDDYVQYLVERMDVDNNYYEDLEQQTLD